MIALGTAQLGMAYGVASAGRPGPLDVQRILDAAIDRGIRYLDTAGAYGDAEEQVGAFLRRGRPDGLRVCTKVAALPAGLPAAELASHVHADVDRSRRRLGADRLDDLLVHAFGNVDEYGGALMDVLSGLVDRGVVGRMGVSVYDPDEAARALRFSRLEVLQFPFNALDTRFADPGLVSPFRERFPARFARSVFLQGLLLAASARGDTRVPGAGPFVARFVELCGAWGLTRVEGAIHFARARAAAGALVVGVESVAQLDAVVNAASREAAPGFVDAVSAAFPDVPRHVRDPRAWPSAA